MTLEAEIAALRARIAELEAPVLPETVRQVMLDLMALWADQEAAENRDIIVRTKDCITRQVALLTRLSSFSEEDVERVTEIACKAMMEHADPEFIRRIWPDGKYSRRFIFDMLIRAALTAHLRQTGERGD